MKRTTLTLILICTAFAVCIVACKKATDDNNNNGNGNGGNNGTVKPPTLQTTAVSNIAPTSAQSGGNITSNGGADVTERGVCWSTATNPTASNSRTNDGSGSGAFASTIVGLTPNTTYYVRAFAINSADTAYGNQVSFKTGAITVPAITTKTAAAVKQVSAQSGGNITSDGGANITARGICWNTSPNPTISNSKTSDGVGVGSFTSTLISITPNTTYYVRAYATNSVGTAYGAQVSFTTLPLSIPGAGVIDIDGNTYTTIILGDKEWMAQNLRVTRYRNGEAIQNAANATDWKNAGTAGTGAWCYYNNTPGYNATYGKLYNQYAVVDPRQACPAGWHAPSSGEWGVLIAYLGGTNVAGGALKQAGVSSWASPNTGATNVSGFTALPGGFRYSSASGFSGFGTDGLWWATDANDIWRLYYGNANTQFQYAGASAGISVRCTKD